MAKGQNAKKETKTPKQRKKKKPFGGKDLDSTIKKQNIKSPKFFQTVVITKKEAPINSRLGAFQIQIKWSGGRDSNPRQPAWKIECRLSLALSHCLPVLTHCTCSVSDCCTPSLIMVVLMVVPNAKQLQNRNLERLTYYFPRNMARAS